MWPLARTPRQEIWCLSASFESGPTVTRFALYAQSAETVAVEPLSEPELVLSLDETFEEQGPWILRAEGVSELRGAIWVRVEPGPSESLATDLGTGIFGVGDSIEDALADLWAAMREHLSVLERRDLSRSPQAEAQLAYLRAHIV